MKGQTIGEDVVITSEGNCGLCGQPAADLVRLGTQFDPQTAYSWTRFQISPCGHVYTVLHSAEFNPIVKEMA